MVVNIILPMKDYLHKIFYTLDGYFVWTTLSFKYCFTIAFPVALFPDFEALLEVTFQSLARAVALTVAFVQVDEVPVYLNVPVILMV